MCFGAFKFTFGASRIEACFTRRESDIRPRKCHHTWNQVTIKSSNVGQMGYYWTPRRHWAQPVAHPPSENGWSSFYGEWRTDRHIWYRWSIGSNDFSSYLTSRLRPPRTEPFQPLGGHRFDQELMKIRKKRDAKSIELSKADAHWPKRSTEVNILKTEAYLLSRIYCSNWFNRCLLGTIHTN